MVRVQQDYSTYYPYVYLKISNTCIYTSTQCLTCMKKKSHPSNELSFLVHADVEASLSTFDADPTPKRVCLHYELGYRPNKQTNEQKTQQ